MSNKKISDLPQVTTLGANDKFYVVANGTSSYITKSNLLTQLSTESVEYYGMIIHQSNSSPTTNIEYIGKNANFTPMSVNLSTGAVSLNDWVSMPTIVKNVPAMIKTNGTLDYYLNPNNYAKKLDGTTDSDVSNLNYDGNAFAWFEPIWMRIEATGTDLDVRFAYKQLDSSYFEVCPAGCGLWLPMFYGYYDGSKMRSIAGTSPLAGRTGNSNTATQYSSITANGSNYMFYGGKVEECISLLQMMWFKTTNSDNVARGNQDGYNSSDTSTYGTKGNPVVNGGRFFGTSDGKSANKFLHCIPLATYDVWLRDPYFLTVNGEFKLSTDYTYDLTGATYKATGVLAPAQGYETFMTPIQGFGLVPTATGGNQSTYYCDHFWINNTITSVSLRRGVCTDGRLAGGRALYCSHAAGHSDWHDGCAMMLKQTV